MDSAKQPLPEIPHLHWCWYRMEDMQPLLLYDMLALRECISVVEQSCLYHGLDSLDKTAQHLLVSHERAIIACLRLLPPARKQSRARIG